MKKSISSQIFYNCKSKTSFRGEINTIRGNADRMVAREETMLSPCMAEAFGLPRDSRGTLVTENYMTPTEGILAAGDCRGGQSLVVWGIAEGRACARAVDQYLMGYTNML